MIRGLHYLRTELKTKIDVIPRSCFNIDGQSDTGNIRRAIRVDTKNMTIGKSNLASI